MNGKDAEKDGAANNSTGKIVVAVILLLLALSVGTYAYIDMSQHKLDAAAGDGAAYQVTLHNIFDPTQAVDWKTTTVIDLGTPGELPKDIYVTSHEDSAPTYVRVRLMEFMGFGSDYPYTQKRFVTNPQDGHFLVVDGSEPVVGSALNALENLAGGADALAALVGHEATVDDLYWFQTKLDQYSGPQDIYAFDTTDPTGGWFLKSGKNGGATGATDDTARDGQLGAYLQYMGYASYTMNTCDIAAETTRADCEAEHGTWSGGVCDIATILEETACENATGTWTVSKPEAMAPGRASGYESSFYRVAEKNEPNEPLITSAKEASVDATDVTVDNEIVANGTLEDGSIADTDVPQSGDLSSIATAADDYMIDDLKYMPVDYKSWKNQITTAQKTEGTLSTDFRQYVKLNFNSANVIFLNDFTNQTNVWVIDDTDGNDDGWVYWIGENDDLTGALPSGAKTSNLLDGVQLVKQPSESFAYSQYVSMQAVDKESLSEYGTPGDDIPQQIFDAWTAEPAVASITTDLSSYIVGDLMEINGSDFEPGEEITEVILHSTPRIIWTPSAPDEIIVGVDGTFTISGIVVPDEPGAGHAVGVIGTVNTAEVQTNANITVIKITPLTAPAIKNFDFPGTSNSRLNLIGENFLPEESVDESSPIGTFIGIKSITLTHTRVADPEDPLDVTLDITNECIIEITEDVIGLNNDGATECLKYRSIDVVGDITEENPADDIYAYITFSVSRGDGNTIEIDSEPIKIGIIPVHKSK